MEEGRRYISRKNGKCTRESGKRAEAARGTLAHLPGRGESVHLPGEATDMPSTHLLHKKRKEGQKS